MLERLGLNRLQRAWANTRYGRLAQRGILGMNARNIRFISRYNDRSLFPLVDDKLKTKKLALNHGVNVPRLIGVIDNQHETPLFAQMVSGAGGFCIKPAKGSGGKGILVIERFDGNLYYKTNGATVTSKEIERHISNILAGLFSLGGKMDVAVIESMIRIDDAFLRYSHEGVPDLRVIVFRGFPVMSMMRLSCASSKGKANLHQGAVGVGIDIDSGCAVRAVQGGHAIEKHPDTEVDLTTLKVPQWMAMLELACACSDMTGLGYLGVDLVLDKELGPLLLELNARPGLAIQVANDAGLLPRLRHIEKLPDQQSFSIVERVAYSRAHFQHPFTLADWSAPGT